MRIESKNGGEAMERVGIVGAGTMGRGIAYVAITHGAQVTLYDVAPGALESAAAQIEAWLREAMGKGRLDEAEAQRARERLRLSTALEDFAQAEVIIEAAPEDLALKQEIFRQLDRACPPDAILASNTSSLSITALGAVTRRPERVGGMHFFNPAPVMRLVEIVRGLATSEETLRALSDLARRWGKTPVLVKDTPGFIVNRVARPFYLEALRLVGESVADPPTVDRLVRALGFRMGPFELMDLIGLDVNLAVSESLYRAFFEEPRFRPHPLQRQMVQAGRLGRKTGRGWYEYP
ncbi:MAG: 3-hydroxyacyl-CoA dehydrogenase NAD-binding domain-containing protein [Anaerolineae bacterium]|uniref:3-hydroxyacyl-CoA dehydrogenase NAD-binding domain-containing protein n=2 Tax=Thermoflexus sp. TaxID=1969742 RepID=UPI0025D8295F|nr:3-hydroxyacyl-CoA dehydrogenase NAD-binding domain-containing protein [Thermoflexus sp.]MCS7350535.1 3-hydroxyacyl-CoA dehydrogenase NAD-binding domain-containing protein [Thermoflexus sp.]MDW8179986.1 3-hydroxyacyl-CoA dehydrogenase NAD-binding domain-containing protein [Anaerolineae bacterium]